MNNLALEDYSEATAIVGMTGRFPGAKTIDEFWQNLRDGMESITFFTAEELTDPDIDHPALLNNPKYIGAEGIVDDIDMFDAEFFNYTPREAEIMDPQHRLFLECAWEVLESAGYDSESYDGRIGVYAGSGMSSYLIRNILSHSDLYEKTGIFQTTLANDKDFVATKVSYKFNLKGPSINVNTLCSSSFVAIHLACQSLLNYQCDLALAGGVSIPVSHDDALFYQEGGIGDPDGHCRAFDANARGTVAGSGLGIVVLKRLEDALTEGDYIHAVIRATAINNDGSEKISYTAPSVEGQAEVITEALALGGVHPETVTYVETHGTGTILGDPIEVAALTKAFRAYTQKKGYCAIGSVKTNIGHLVNAGAVVSLIKTVLALEHKQIPASLNFEKPNPKIDFANSPFYVNAKLSEWKTEAGVPRRAGVSSFGIGGTNVHLIVEEAPEIEPSGEFRPWQLLLLSAKTGSALEKQTMNLLEHLKQSPDISLADVAYTFQVGRRAFSHRRMLLCHNLEDVINALSTMDSERVLTRFQESKNRLVAFMFSGLGEQYVNMGLELYQSEPTFREQVDLCSDVLKPYLTLDLRHVLYPSEARAEKAAQQLEHTVIAQAALFVIEYALASLWMEWGVCPRSMIGDGIGEYVAACLAGVFSLEDVLALVVAHGRVQTNDASLESFTDRVKKVSLNPPRISYVSSLTGDWITEGEATEPGYWARHVRQTVRFVEGVGQLLEESEQVLLEVGPDEALSRLTLQHPRKATRQVVLSSLRRQDPRSDVECLLTTLGQLWLAGVRVDWSGFSAHERRHRLPLPTYPFERQRYWIEPLKPEARRSTGGSLESGKPIITKKPDIADWFYIQSWKRSLLPTHPAEAPVETCWLLFVDECGLGSQLVQRLEQEGQSVVTVEVGSEFARLSDRAFTLNPGQRDDYDALLNELGKLDKRPKKIVHLWSVTHNGQATSVLERIDQAQDSGFYSLLFLSQALGKQFFTDELQVTVVSNNLQQVTADDTLCPEKATLLGPVKVIPQEYPNITCRGIDVVLPKAGTRQEYKLIDYLWAELAQKSTDTVVAYRGHHRWVQTFEPVRLGDSIEASSHLREGGVYLIVGGLEGIGLVLAEHLAQTSKAKLALIKDADFPTRDRWESWLSLGVAGGDVNRQNRKLQELEMLGAKVLVVGADVTDRRQMQTAIAQAEERFGQLNGVIYAAGGFGRRLFHAIEETDKTESERQFQPAIHGLLVLEEALREKEIDFCLLISSLSSILGGLGLVTYVAANNFMDAFARQNGRTNPIPWISANWDSLKFEQEHAKSTASGAELDELAITPTQGGETFRRILSCGEVDQLIVSTGDLQARIDRWVNLESRREDEQSEDEKAILLHARPNLPNPYVAPHTEVERTIVDVWQELMGIEQIGIYDDFFELGGHSLLATQIISRMRKTFEIDLPLNNLFEQPNVAFLAEYIETVRWAAQGLQAAPIAQEEGRKEIEF